MRTESILKLYERSEHRIPLRAHDLRATFVTLALANGKTEAWVMKRTGHTTSMMLKRYRRDAESIAELNLGWLSALHEAISGAGGYEVEGQWQGRAGGGHQPLNGEVQSTQIQSR